MRQLVFDSETYSNYLLFMFKDINDGSTFTFESYEGQPLNVRGLEQILSENEIIGFNSANFDIPIVSYALLPKVLPCDVKQLADAIIKRDLRPWQAEREFDFKVRQFNHIDISEPAPGVAVSLKSYAGRLHCPVMQDLPIEPDAEITPDQRPLMRRYCRNDLDVTEALYRSIEKQIDLRRAMTERYGVDLRSKSDAQIAEAVIKAEVEKIRGTAIERPSIPVGTEYRYRCPKFINYQTPLLNGVLAQVKAATFRVDKNGAIEMPEDLAKLKVSVGGSTYQMGIGGLHSTEKSTAHVADAEHVLVDRDVASYYPSIILRCKLYPKHMGQAFLQVYEGFVRQRLQAKKEGNAVVRDSFKILLNGTFGKLGSKYSILYSPDLMLQVTITGQLALLQLIEHLELRGIPVVSANTDGIVIKCPRSKVGEMESIIGIWEFFTCFETEETRYIGLYSKDVNNYLAIKPDGSTKTKGLYAEAGLMKNPTALVAVDAVKKFLTDGASIEQTIRGCTDISRFVTIRGVKGGGVQDDKFLGKTVRWYYATSARGKTINYRSNGNKVAKSEGAKALMALPKDFPTDIDYAVYEAEAQSILTAIGAA